ncbi:hypothetical protein SAMN04489712_13224 [Thermomonospora echinospora]|uniref:Uncharacterized protein n=1 Tax=Thermomonospora echinospora TaxID=1992 RepID=A0A1H6E4D8_9ACTN|nr:hypothetical protein SAMN04489712_13224 [Thermomonospora echinospora]
MALGRLADYSSLLPPAVRAILLPERPKRADLIAPAHSQGVAVLWPEGTGYGSSDPAIRL